MRPGKRTSKEENKPRVTAISAEICFGKLSPTVRGKEEGGGGGIVSSWERIGRNGFYVPGLPNRQDTFVWT